MADLKNSSATEKTASQDDAQAPIDSTPMQPQAESAETAVGDSAPDLVIVTFLEHWALYSVGEKAGFPAEKADWLISRKLAEKA